MCPAKQVLAIVFLAALAAQSPAPARPAILGVAHVRLLSSDIQRSRAFYVTLLGLPEVPQSKGMVAIFRVNDRQRIILRRAFQDADDRLVDVAFETTDRDAARAWLTSHGLSGTTADEPGEAGGDAVETNDPDGHRIRLIKLTSGPMPHDGPEKRISTRILSATSSNSPRIDDVRRLVFGNRRRKRSAMLLGRRPFGADDAAAADRGATEGSGQLGWNVEQQFDRRREFHHPIRANEDAGFADVLGVPFEPGAVAACTVQDGDGQAVPRRAWDVLAN